MISGMQSRWPTKLILIGKTDLDLAYCRIHANATTASTYIAIVNKLSSLCLRLPFGTTPAPAEYTTVSEAAIDLGNNLLRDESWDTDDLNSPHQSLLPQEEKQQSASHLATADPLAVDITATEASMDGFINYIITITVDDKHWIDRKKSAALLVIHALFQPLRPSEPLKQDDPLSLRKLMGEGQLSEHKTCLGWDINTHSLRLSLLEEKQTSWTNDIKDALASKKIKTDTLGSLIEKLNHTAHVIPTARYLLNRLRHLLKRGDKWGPQRLQLWNRLDLQLWMKKFLQRVTTKGVPINKTVFVKPSVMLWSDSCKYVIGGYSENGLAWRWRIPAAWHGKLVLNLIEFLASAVTI